MLAPSRLGVLGLLLVVWLAAIRQPFAELQTRVAREQSAMVAVPAPVVAGEGTSVVDAEIVATSQEAVELIPGGAQDP